MYINNLDIPNDIIQAAQEGHLVVFAGAGVSMGAPTSMPDFNTLTEKITTGTGEIKGEDESSEVFLGRINHSGVDVKKRTASILSEKGFIHNDLHKFIIELFPSAEKIRIVTTNYDKMFEQVLSNKGVSPIKIYDAPALPLGDNFSGIAHIHGNVDDPSTIIITDEDFGQAYMAEGYVSRFLIKLFDSYTVLFIGYSYNDIIVSYLTRAITKNKNQKKYIFVPESSNKWDELGIKPIVYGKGNHSLLNDTVNKLGIIANRSLLDWKAKFKMFAMDPTDDLSIDSEIDYCLETIEKTNVLAMTIHGKKWFWKLYNKNVFDNLFTPRIFLTAKDQIWLEWITSEFFTSDINIFKKAIIQKNNQLNEDFADKLLNCLYFKELSDDYICDYVVLLEQFINNPLTMYRIIEVLMEHEIYNLAWKLFIKLFDYRVIIDKKLLSLEKDEFEYKHRLVGENSFIYMACKKYGDKIIELFPLEFMAFVKEHIEKIQLLYSYKPPFFHQDAFGYYWVSIEGDKSNSYRDKTIPFFKSSLLKIIEKTTDENEPYIRWYINQCIHSKAVMLRRLGLILLRESNIFSDEEKIELLFKNFSLYSIEEKEQIFLLIAKIFDNLDDDLQCKLIEKIKADSSDEDEYSYEKFNWFVWIKNKCSTNQKIQKEIEDIKRLHPNFEERDHPELSIYFSSAGYIRSKSPILKEDMFDMVKEDLISTLKSFNAPVFEEESREGLLNALSNCVKDDFEWTKDLVTKLLSDSEALHKKDIWQYIYRGIKSSTYLGCKSLEILSLLDNPVLIENTNYEMADLLHDMVKTDYISENIGTQRESLLDMFKKVWNTTARENRISSDKVIDLCFNTTDGLLIYGIIQMLSLETHESAFDKYKDIFEMALDSNGRDKRVIIGVIVGHASFIFRRNSVWCVEKLFPYLESKNDEELSIAWEGFVSFSSNVYSDIAFSMQPIYMSTLKRIDVFKEETRKGFIELLTLIILYFVESPVEIYIPKLFKYADEKDYIRFSNKIGSCLKGMATDVKNNIWNNWLQQYWKNRIDNIPKKLSPNEKKSMIYWIFNLAENYSAAIQCAIKMGYIGEMDDIVFNIMGNCNMVEKYPEDTAKLLIYLLSSSNFSKWGLDEAKDIAKKVIDKVSINKSKLVEAFIKKGISL